MSDLAPFLQTLRDRLTITDVIRPHVKLIRKGREYSGLCPFHQEKSPSFTASDEKGFYHCFGCGAHGDIFDFVMHKQNMPFMEAVELLANLLGLDVPKRQPDPASGPVQPKPDVALYEVMEAACRWYQQQLTLAHGALARTCFEQRGLLPETITQFRLGYAPEHGLQAALHKQGFSEALMLEAGLIGRAEERKSTYDRFRNRLMFPIWDAKGRIIAFGGRILKEGEPKYLNSPDTPAFTKGKTLYAYNFALPATRQQEPLAEALIIVEGYMDVIAMHQAGLKSAVAPLGTALTPEQMALLWRSPGTPVLCFDGDGAGMRAAHRAAQKALGVMKVGQTFQFCFLPPGEDPDSLIRSGKIGELHGKLKNPQPLVDVLWSIFMQGRVLSTPEQKAIARRDLGHLMKEIADPDVRHFYREDLNNRLLAIMEPKGRISSSSHQGKGQWRPFKSFLSSTASVPPSFVVSRIPPNKNHLGHKILLATLINHPTLIEDAAESLMVLSEGTEECNLFQAMLSIMAEKPTLSAVELQDFLRQKGFTSLLAEILTPQIFSLAPFAKETAEREEALAGWREVWKKTVHEPRMNEERTAAANVVATHFQAEDWEKYKLKRLLEAEGPATEGTAIYSLRESGHQPSQLLETQAVFKKDEK
ncbi:MAG: primase [Alphaproteobacteria bacterium]|jgi:DNA primase|nr:primase [Alphaproteobacteria bacterium]